MRSPSPRPRCSAARTGSVIAHTTTHKLQQPPLILCVPSYEEYLAKTALYRRKDWQNAVTGKMPAGGFTYAEALRDEEKTLAQLAKVCSVVCVAVCQQSMGVCE